MKRWTKLAVGTAAVAAVAVTAACGTKAADNGSSSSGSGSSSEPRTLNVWFMKGSLSDDLTSALNKDFESSHPGVTVKYEPQEWKGIADKLSTALVGKQTPDIVELGNTQTAKFAADNVLTDLTDSKKDLNGDQWLKGLVGSGTWDNKNYAMPLLAANRVVIYRKDMFDKAGITKPPASNDEWLSAMDKLKTAYASDPDFQALYLPGQEWYTLLSFIWDQGGDIARQDGKDFKGTLDSAQAKAGIEFYKKLYEASGTKAPKDNDDQNPDQSGELAKGHIAMEIGLPWEIAKTDPNKAQYAAFPIPGKDSGKSAPVFLGGSNVAIAQGSKNQDLAKDYLKLLSTPKYQAMIAKAGLVPGTSTDTSAIDADPIASVMAKASQNGKYVPASPKWTAVETGQNPLKDLTTAVLTGAKSLDQAVADANKSLNSTLAG